MDKQIMMPRQYKFLCLVAFLVVSVMAGEVQPKPARWTNKDNWRQRLKVGMSPAAVKTVLGEPAYEEVRQSSVIFYYQTFAEPDLSHPGPLNPADAKSAKQYLGYNGKVVFSLKAASGKSRKTSLSVERWEEPAWESLSSPLPGERIERKPPVATRRLEAWEVTGNWRRLSEGMDQKTVEGILGKPMAETEDAFAVHVSGHLYVEWQYGPGNAKGIVKFSGSQDAPKGTLTCYEWKEPFWPVIEATFCPDPNKPAKAEKK
jgi:hypothetical protein